MQHCFPVLLVYFKPEDINNNSALKCDHVLFGDVFFGNSSVFTRRGGRQKMDFVQYTNKNNLLVNL